MASTGELWAIDCAALERCLAAAEAEQLAAEQTKNDARKRQPRDRAPRRPEGRRDA